VHLASIVLELVVADSEETTETLKRMLQEQSGYFLQVGDFQTLLDLHAKIRSYAEDRSCEAGTRCQQLLMMFSTPEFIEGVLEGARIWGKSKYIEIGWLIADIRTAFIGPLLDRLEVEENLSMRRFYVNQLINLGPIVRDMAVARLDNVRWYFVRNLLVILRHLGDPSVLTHVSMLVDHPHPKVRQEIVKTLIHFCDPAGDRLLLQDLSSPEPEKRLAAVTIAGKSRSPKVLSHLIGVLTAGGLTDGELTLKKAAVQALAEMGSAQAVPALEGLLRSRNLLYSVALLELKTEILKSLHRYPPSAVEHILTEMAGSVHARISAQATEALKQLRRGAQ